MVEHHQQYKTIFDFSAVSSEAEWDIINDGVMGGISRSRFSIRANGLAEFSGEVSLENNGGFASCRSLPHDFKLAGFADIVVRVRGDGKRYSLRLKTDTESDGVIYQVKFASEEDKWIEIVAPFASFKPTFRGKLLPDILPLKPEEIRQIGFLISDRQPGGFKLLIDWIKAYKSTKSH